MDDGEAVGPPRASVGGRTPEATAGAAEEWVGSSAGPASHARALTVSRRRLLAGFGMVAIAVVAGTVGLAATGRWQVAGGSGHRPEVSEIEWQPAGGEFRGTTYVLNDRLWSFADGVHTSKDGANWDEVAPASTFAGQGGARIEFTAVGEDGRGGIVAFGCMRPLTGPCPADGSANAAWHSVDGRTWTQTPFRGWVASTAVLGTTIVATSLGDRFSPGTSTDRAWYSLDGVSWSEADTSAAWAWQPGDVIWAEPFEHVFLGAPIAWHGRFYAVGIPSRIGEVGSSCLAGCDADPYVGWEMHFQAPIVATSPDGKSWQRAAILETGPRESRDIPKLAQVGDQLLAVGFGHHQALAWRSPDGTTWTRLKAPVRNGTDDPPVTQTLAIVHGGDLIVIANDDDDRLASVWATRDGSSWRQLDAGPWSGSTMRATGYGDRIFLSPAGGSGGEWVGNLEAESE